jgi:low affinity Fe/Cu permease
VPQVGAGMTTHEKDHARTKSGDWFDGFARKASLLCGKPVVFLLAVATVVGWAATGPLFGFSDTWQLVINTGTTIITFLMVFLIQNTQNRDSMAVQVKLAELILALKGAQNRLANCEELSEEELTRLHDEYREKAKTLDGEIANRQKAKRPRVVKIDPPAKESPSK